MEINLIQKPLQYMRPFFSQIHTQEQTQEIRLPDAYPDIGKILGCWGKPLIRGKEWRSTSIGANGSVMVWVIYAPEDGSNPRVLDVSLPTQCRWDFPEAADDGVIVLNPSLSNLDCRGISARKILVRASVDTFAQVLCREKTQVAEPMNIPEDVQLLRRSYPVELLSEAGEKQVQIEEVLPFEGELPVYKIVSYDMHPNILEQKILGNRMIFRGENRILMMYMTEDGAIYHWETVVPFSQYAELDREYGPETQAWMLPVMTAMELEITDDHKIMMRSGIAVQYTVFGGSTLEIVEDAFSPIREVEPVIEELNLPVLLDSTTQQLQMSGLWRDEMDRVQSLQMFAEYPKYSSTNNGIQLRTDGNFQVLYENDGQLMSNTGKAEGQIEFATARENQIHLWMGNPDKPEIQPSAEGESVRCSYPVTVQVYSGKSIPMVTQLQLGEQYQPDPDRPSIVLRRAGEQSLWEIAKGYRSTMNAIRQANNLTGEPDFDQMLLIPLG